MNRSSIVVIVPGEFGLEVCDLTQLLDNLMDDEHDEFDAVVIDSSIDQFDGSPEHVARIRAANETGDFRKYWGLDKQGAAHEGLAQATEDDDDLSAEDDEQHGTHEHEHEHHEHD